MSITRRVTIGFVLTATCLATAGCAGQNHLTDSPGAANANAATLQSLKRKVVYERLLLCRRAWFDYEDDCRRNLLVYRGYPRREFCGAFARGGWPEQVLPRCGRLGR